MAAHDLIFLENRRTPKVVSRGAKYKPKPSEGKIVKRRKANAEEEKTIAKGDWVRVAKDGSRPGDAGYKSKNKSKIRPHLNAAAVTAAGPEERELDESDERDDLAVEALLAAALAQTLFDADPTSPSPATVTGAWSSVVEGSIGLGLKAYMLRVALRMLREAGVDPVRSAELANEVVDSVYPQAVAAVGSRVGQAYDKSRGVSEGSVPFGPGSRGGKPGPVEATKPPLRQAPGLPPAPNLEAPTSGDEEASSGPLSRTPIERDTEAYRRIRVGSAAIARHAATEVRERVRFALAGVLGASTKTWRTRRDPKVRPTHGGLEHETVAYGEPWVTFNGSRLMFPGDTSAPPGDWMNCRCSAAYRVPVGASPEEEVGPPRPYAGRFEDVGVPT